MGVFSSSSLFGEASTKDTEENQEKLGSIILTTSDVRMDTVEEFNGGNGINYRFLVEGVPGDDQYFYSMTDPKEWLPGGCKCYAKTYTIDLCCCDCEVTCLVM